MIAVKSKAVLFAALILVLFTAFAAQSQTVPKMSGEELKARLGKPNVVVLDVRAEHDWDTSQWKIQGAIREDPSKADEWKGKYQKDKTYVLYCA